MQDDDTPPKGQSIPSGRVARLASFGGLASGIAGNMIAEGAKRVARGERPQLQDLLLTPSNAGKVADQLARLRGAAMKVGQLISMDAGDLIPPELADILARLRSSAQPMPPKQLDAVLVEGWGKGWRRQFRRFEVAPMAAASIGQVHRALTRDGRDLAVKVQYPGVRQSIDSDVDNVATLIKLTGLMPKTVDLSGFLADAKSQLHDEADYLREGAQLARFGELLAGDDGFLVPGFHKDLTTPDILAMDYVEGRPVESAAEASQETRDQVVTRLVTLFLREMFEFGVMQTDPNFANYLYQEETGKVVLLDFGAARDLSPDLVSGYRDFLRAGMEGGRDDIHAAATRFTFLSDAMPQAQQTLLLDIFEMSLEPLKTGEVFDFGASDLAQRIRDAGMAFNDRREIHHVPPTDTFFVQRKIAGMYLLGARLAARVPLADYVRPYLAAGGDGAEV